MARVIYVERGVPALKPWEVVLFRAAYIGYGCGLVLGAILWFAR